MRRAMPIWTRKKSSTLASDPTDEPLASGETPTGMQSAHHARGSDHPAPIGVQTMTTRTITFYRRRTMTSQAQANRTEICDHATTTTIGEPGPYNGSVAVHPYTEENRAAHGNIEEVEECTCCGARRRVLVNRRHVEVGPWGPTAKQRAAAERAKAEQARREQEAIEDATCESRKVKVMQVRDEQALVSIDGQPKWTWIESVRDAASQSDNGDGLVPLYRGILRRINAAAD